MAKAKAMTMAMTRFAEVAGRFRAGLDRWVGGMLIALMTIAVINVLWQVVSRYVLDDPSSYTEELARYLLVWLALFGAAYAVGERSHLAIDLLPRRLRGRSRLVLEAFIAVCVLAFAALVLAGGGGRYALVMLRTGQTSPALRIPMGWIYAGVPAAGALMTLYAVLDIIRVIGTPVVPPDDAGAAPVDTEATP